MSKTKKTAITQDAISELEKLSLSLDTELEVTASMPIEEVEEGLRQMGLDPDQELPASISQLASEEDQEQTLITHTKAIERVDNTASVQSPRIFLSYSHSDSALRDQVLEALNKPQKEIYLTFNDECERAYGRAAYALRDLDLAEKVTIDVADAFETWCVPSDFKTNTCYPQYYIELNKSLMLDSLIFKKILPYKKKQGWEHRTGVRQLDDNTITLWFVEELMGFALDHDFSYAVIAICDLLYNFNPDDVRRIHDVLNPASSLQPEVYRRHKKRIINSLGRHFGDYLFEKTDKKRVRIKESDDLSRTFWLIEDWLKLLTPPPPRDLLQDENFGLGAYDTDLAPFIAQGSQDASGYLAEWKRIHSLVNPYCFSNLVRRMNITSPEQRLSLPEFYLFNARRRKWKDAFGRLPHQAIDQQQRKRIEAELGRRRKRREDLSLSALTIVVDDTEHGVVSLDKHPSFRIKLKEGAGLVEFKGNDKEGSIPIGTHVLQWDASSASKEQGLYQINMQGKQILSYTIKYTRDARGDLSGVILEDAADPITT